MTPLDQYQESLNALLSAREAAQGRLAPFENDARLNELDGLNGRQAPRIGFPKRRFRRSASPGDGGYVVQSS
jgi:hypothetical protein